MLDSGHDRKVNPISGGLLIVVGIVLFFAGTAGLIFVSPGGPLIGVGVILLAFGALQVINLGRRMRSPGAVATLRSDPRAPVIYLRPFRDDGVLWHLSFLRSHRRFSPTAFLNRTYEQRLAHGLKGLGPFVAIGSPGENRPDLGASRFYVKDPYWQQTVSDLINTAQLVVLHTGESDGLIWECHQALEQCPPEKLILCLEMDAETGEKPITKRYHNFRNKTLDMFRKPLPKEIGAAQLIYFESDWTPRLLVPEGNFSLGHLGVSGVSLSRTQVAALRTLHQEFERVTTPYWIRAGAFLIGSMAIIPLLIFLETGPVVPWLDRQFEQINQAAATGPTAREVFDKYRPAFNKIRGKLRTIAKKLPPVGTVLTSGPIGELVPQANYRGLKDGNAVAVMMFDQLLNPDTSPGFDLHFNSNLMRGLYLTGPLLSWTDEDLEKRGQAALAAQLEQALLTPYLLIYRLDGIYLPGEVSRETYDQGELRFEGFLIDLRNLEILASHRTIVKAMQPYPFGFNPSQPFGPYYTPAREAAAQAFEQIIEGTFNYAN